ncbi:MAG: four helix bundle protein [Verrucomicrobia bacterium]|nr:four helix bundle protein [Verrucomicrobiota bacterium]
MAFSHEKLIVYQKSLQFNGSAYTLITEKKIKGNLIDQLSRASQSMALNIAEGNGKFSKSDRANFFQRSQGSATECAACLDLLVTENRISQEQADFEKEILEKIVRILVKMTENLRNDSVNEGTGFYGSDLENYQGGNGEED